MISLKNLLTAFLSLLCLSLQARETKVSNPSELEKAVNSANAGDVLIMEKGFWQDANILINKGSQVKGTVSGDFQLLFYLIIDTVYAYVLAK